VSNSLIFPTSAPMGHSILMGGWLGATMMGQEYDMAKKSKKSKTAANGAKYLQLVPMSLIVQPTQVSMSNSTAKIKYRTRTSFVTKTRSRPSGELRQNLAVVCIDRGQRKAFAGEAEFTDFVRLQSHIVLPPDHR
jgi:hypothetical protein